jgi:UDP-2,4-diacetamido-2,4,6-trideoxy-beta-L-altropyranose hydrolase
MKVLFRADASFRIGTGHVMRCLTLGAALKAKGAEISFVCRQLEGNLIDFIKTKGFHVFTLPCGYQENEPHIDNAREAYLDWLGTTQQKDIMACKPILEQYRFDWLVVDHYALDYRWELALKKYCHKLMVIDDLADRKHFCHLLLDQTYGRDETDYKSLVPGSCKLLLGSQYALLRPDFAMWREFSLKRRYQPQLKKLLISLGGADPENYTGQVLHALVDCDLPGDLQVTVVIGPSSPHMALVRKLAAAMPYKTEVVCNVSNMAELMATSDLAIGAAGASTWERCCLGLPSIMFVLAENQKTVAENLGHDGIVEVQKNLHKLPSTIAIILSRLVYHSNKAAEVTDGMGTVRVSNSMELLG